MEIGKHADYLGPGERKILFFTTLKKNTILEDVMKICKHADQLSLRAPTILIPYPVESNLFPNDKF